jgi:hypothetical protein
MIVFPVDYILKCFSTHNNVMVMRTCTGSGTAQAADGEVNGSNGKPFSKNIQIAGMVGSEFMNTRILGFLKTIGSPRALAYLAATAQHEDVKEAAKKAILSRGLLILSAMTGRTLEPWEKEVVKLMREGLKDYDGWDKMLIDAKLTQVERGKNFGAYDNADGVQFVDESAPEFSEDRLAKILDASQA